MKKPAHTLRSRSFPIIIPASEGRPAKKMDTITVQVWKDEDGQEFLTLESRELIERTRAKYMGLMHGAETGWADAKGRKAPKCHVRRAEPQGRAE